jgi:Ser/Thr protein kinase RdoA (MazF antagonist)
MAGTRMNTAAIASAHRAAETFALTLPVQTVAPLGRGLINDTFLVTDATGNQAVLQRINRRAFPTPERILENLRTLLAHVNARAGAALRLPGIVPTRDRQDWTVDADGDFWRMLTYIAGSVTHERLTDATQAGEVGSALGRFHALVRDLPTERLHVVRGGFHQTPLYFERFREALARAPAPDSEALRFCIEFANAREAIVNTLEDAKRQGVLALRVVHGDPKIDNILFDAASGRAISLIDLDTVQPGLLHYDVGDCLRSACNPAGESPATASQAHFDLGLCAAWLTRYVAETRAFLTAADIRYLPDAIRLIPFELGLRFLADYLNGNVYFKVQWPEQNLLRAETQFRLTASIETQLAALRALVADAVARA